MLFSIINNPVYLLNNHLIKTMGDIAKRLERVESDLDRFRSAQQELVNRALQAVEAAVEAVKAAADADATIESQQSALDQISLESPASVETPSTASPPTPTSPPQTEVLYSVEVPIKNLTKGRLIDLLNDPKINPSKMPVKASSTRTDLQAQLARLNDDKDTIPLLYTAEELTVPLAKQLLKQKGLPTTGSKADLINRLKPPQRIASFNLQERLRRLQEREITPSVDATAPSVPEGFISFLKIYAEQNGKSEDDVREEALEAWNDLDEDDSDFDSDSDSSSDSATDIATDTDIDEDETVDPNLSTDDESDDDVLAIPEDVDSFIAKLNAFKSSMPRVEECMTFVYKLYEKTAKRDLKSRYFETHANLRAELDELMEKYNILSKGTTVDVERNRIAFEALSNSGMASVSRNIDALKQAAMATLDFETGMVRLSKALEKLENVDPDDPRAKQKFKEKAADFEALEQQRESLRCKSGDWLTPYLKSKYQTVDAVRAFLEDRAR